MRWLIVLVAVVFVLFVVGWRLAFAGTPPAVGNAAPEFILPSQDGKPISLKDFRGKWVVLYFYPKDFTSGCTVEAHNFQRDQEHYARRNTVVLGVSVDSVDSHKRFCAKEGLNFKLVADSDHKVASAYGSLINLAVAKIAARHTFILDPQGVIARAYTSVSPNKHSQELLAALDELQKIASSTTGTEQAHHD
jgi:peroxiredoxin Q/BCP